MKVEVSLRSWRVPVDRVRKAYLRRPDCGVLLESNPARTCLQVPASMMVEATSSARSLKGLGFWSLASSGMLSDIYIYIYSIYILYVYIYIYIYIFYMLFFLRAQTVSKLTGKGLPG